MGKKNRSKNTSEEKTYYHGGISGLEVGDLLKPPVESKLSLRTGYEAYDPERIFITTSLDLATAYALSFARRHAQLGTAYAGPGLGSVYRVKVAGPKYIDEDFSELGPQHGGDFSFSIKTKPQILKVVEGDLSPDPQREYRLIAPFETWASPDGAIYPMWDANGYVMPNAHDLKRGVTPQMIQSQFSLGPFPGKDKLIQVGLYIV